MIKGACPFASFLASRKAVNGIQKENHELILRALLISAIYFDYYVTFKTNLSEALH